MVEEEGEGATGLGAGAAGTPRDRTGTEPTSGEGGVASTSQRT